MRWSGFSAAAGLAIPTNESVDLQSTLTKLTINKHLDFLNLVMKSHEANIKQKTGLQIHCS